MKSTAGGWMEILGIIVFQSVIQDGRMRWSGVRHEMTTKERIGERRRLSH